MEWIKIDQDNLPEGTVIVSQEKTLEGVTDYYFQQPAEIIEGKWCNPISKQSIAIIPTHYHE